MTPSPTPAPSCLPTTSVAGQESLPPHIARYLARVDAHLPTLWCNAVKRGFLLLERDKWLERELDFTERISAGKPVSPEVSAFDYAVTLAELDIRRGRIGEGA